MNNLAGPGFFALLTAILLAGGATAAEPVKIGEINSYSAIPAFTIPYRNGWQLAVDEINKAGGILGGRKLQVLSRDDGGQTAQALSAANDLVTNEGVTVLTGSFLANVSLALADFAKQRKVVFLAGEPLTDDLVWSHGNRYTFRLQASSYMQAAMLAERAAKLPAKRWASVAPNYEMGRSLAGNFKRLLKAKRPDVDFVVELWPELGRLDAGAIVEALGQAKPDGIFNATFGGDLNRLVRRGTALFKTCSVVSALTGDPEILDVLADEAPEGWIVTGYPWYDIKTIDHRRFVDGYTAAYKEDLRLSALIGYETMKAVAAALDIAGATDPEKIVAAFEGLTFASPVGPLSFRAADHQSTMGAWVGKTALRDGAGVVVDWVYDDGANYLPPADEAAKMRPKE
jgi:branched-chain amino acid transport system substrate-binding protein